MRVIAMLFAVGLIGHGDAALALARVPQWLSVAGAAVGLAYTLAHGGVR